MRILDFICNTCGKEFRKNKACKSYIPKFCSISCYAISIRKDRKCKVCGQHVTWTNKTYCSMNCCSLDKKGKSLPHHHIKALSASKIGKPIKHLIENREEIRAKISKALLGKPQPWNRGELHSNYTGRASTSERLREMGRVEYKTWRRSVFQRDDYACIICKKRGGRLCADHIKPWALYPDNRYEIDNVRTLCFSCHTKTDTFGGKTIKLIVAKNRSMHTDKSPQS